MALGITWGELATRELTGEYNDPVTGRPMRAITEEEIGLFNADLNALAAQLVSNSIRAALEKYQQQILIVARNVMYETAQPYRGAYAVGDEIVGRALAPIDLAFTAEEIWDLDLSAETVGDIWGYQTGGTTPAAETLGQYEGNIIVGFTSHVPLQGFAKYQLVKGGKTFPYYPLNFAPCNEDGIKFCEVMAPLMEFPLETILINMDVGRAINPERLQAIGLHFCRASAIRTATGSA